MKKRTLFIAVSALLVSQASFAEPHPGEALHNNADCMKCHAAKPYDPKKTDSFVKLEKAVKFCNENLNTGMFEDEVAQLTDYLNQTYYKHPKP